ncbi:hypothetical protein SAMIE_1014050 [Sphingobium amiense]|uniref:Uncharacterized protein n=1 Tax=Sphingobium amiense TaxID=135719 RepID=A0A494VZR3_9SPHN|nr:hypothetical protein [Sphingobium amiense]BBD97904.1 hypothetical protein SAMIE_1014050 [Sphingobium amiense]
MNFGAFFVLIIAAVSSPVSAAVPEKAGQGFHCSFQTGLTNFERLTLWYGQMGRTNVKTPQFVDSGKLFVRGGMAEGNRTTFWVSDEWPDRFTVNYFDPVFKDGFPSALLTIFNRSSDGTLFNADISHFDPKAERSQDGKITPIRTYRGLCEVKLDVTLSAFTNGAQK